MTNEELIKKLSENDVSHLMRLAAKTIQTLLDQNTAYREKIIELTAMIPPTFTLKD